LALAIASKGQGTHFLRSTLSSIAEAYSYSVAYAGHTFCSFPNAETIIERKVKDLAREPVDQTQAEQLHGLASLVTRGELDLKALGRRPTDELLATFGAIAGVDEAGAQLTLLCGYGRLECFPVGDPVLRDWISSNVLGGGKADAAAVAAWAGQWGDLKGLVALYIYAELIKNDEL
jgi:3-methyladenine DNA glycosylase/8-oxoguanine DNA glycosylase